MLKRLVIGGVALAVLLISASQPQAATAARMRWYYLASRPQLQPFGTVYTGLVQIDGQKYARSVYHYVGSGGGEASVQFNLERRCDRLTYVAGVTDESPPEAADEFSVYGGSRLLSKHQLGFGGHARGSVTSSECCGSSSTSSVSGRTEATPPGATPRSAAGVSETPPQWDATGGDHAGASKRSAESARGSRLEG